MEIILFWLLVKHFICDFPLQSFPYMFLNKGTYGHPGGILHAAVHVVGTFLVMAFLIPSMVLASALALLDGVIHYHIDWAKMYTNNYFKLQPATSHWFWILLGFDQLLHQATYFLLAWMAL
jgi:hypothetical protein